MSSRDIQANDTVSRTLTNGLNPVIPWVRNPTWAAMPSITSSNEEVDMLVAVYPESNFIAFTFNTSSGSYLVDWGDTQTSTVASGVTAQHQYTFADANLANTDGPVTFTDAGDTVNRTAHGYTDGMKISFATIVTTTGITAGQVYYVVNSTANTFQVSATLGGSALPLTTDGSGTILPYKQAIIKVTPVTGGATLTTVNLPVKNTTALLQAYIQPILDLAISANVSTLTIGTSTSSLPGLRMMERCVIHRFNVTSLAFKFFECRVLQSLTLPSTASVTSTASMFSDCDNLQTVPLFNTAAVTDMDNMFFNCFSLKEIPAFNTGAVVGSSTSTGFSAMFSGCKSLVRVPLLNTAAGVFFTSMFSGCTSLTTLPLFNLASATNISLMFNGCSALASVPLFNTALVTTFASTFLGCSSLTTVPLFNTASVTIFTGAFSNCISLKAVPLFNTAAATNMSSMFSGCTSLSTVPLFNTASVTTMASMFSGCSALVSVPLFNTAACTLLQSMFSSCTSLTTVPLFNTSAALNMTTMFNSCSSLISVPAFVTTSCTTFANMFTSCSRLQSIGALAVGAAASSADYTTMFGTCASLSSIGCTGHKFTFSVTACKLSPAALDALYTALATVVGQTITVTNNWGTASDTPTIATAKGWTVTG